jgi:hypothetical protein
MQACADKLSREIATYGNPPRFPTEEETAAEQAAQQQQQVWQPKLMPSFKQPIAGVWLPKGTS